MRALLVLLLFIAGAAAHAQAPSAVGRLLDCARESEITLVAAHRAGIAPGVPENSLAGIAWSAAHGAALAEVDLRRTADGVIVLLHDSTLDRTTTGSGRLSDLTLAELADVRLRDTSGAVTDEPVPTLVAAFAAARDAGIVLQLDLKTVSAAEAAQAARDADMSGSVIVIVSTADEARAAQAIDPHIGLSIPVNSTDDLDAMGFDPGATVVWLGARPYDSGLEDALAARLIESAGHDFRAEAEGRMDYARQRAMRREVLATDDVPAAVAALGRGADACPLAAAP